MSQSIGIAGFITERTSDIQQLICIDEDKKEISKKRERITSYRTRSFKRYGMSLTARRKRHELNMHNIAISKPRVLYRRQRRVPRLLQNSFSGELVPSALNNSKRNRHPSTASTADSSPDASTLRLNTHIWHVKRFFMRPEYGWIVPTHHHNRGLKAIDNLLDQCVVEDISYHLGARFSEGRQHPSLYSIRVLGDAASVEGCMRQLTDPLSFALERDEDDNICVTAAFEVDTLLYECGRFPAGCLGPVSLLVVPEPRANTNNLTGGKTDNHRIQVWISCHPAITNSVHTALVASSKNCTVELVPPTTNRLRLRGATSGRAVLSLLHAATDSSVQNQERLRFLRALLSLKSPAKHVSDGDVIAVEIADPRIHAKDSAVESDRPSAAVNKRPVDLSSSALFDPTATVACRRDNEVNDEKHQNKVRQWESMFLTTTPFGEISAASARAVSTVCPLVLIRKEDAPRRHRTHNHQLQGWDVIVAQTWGSTIFAALQKVGGATAVGCVEMDHLRAKAGVTSFPRDFPDTAAGREWWQTQYEKAVAVNLKRPPRKRLLLRSLADLLMLTLVESADRTPTGGSSAASRDLSSLLIVRGEPYLKDFRAPAYEDLNKAQIEETRKNLTAGVPWRSPFIAELPRLPPLMFLQVLLVPSGPGLAQDLAEIILPTVADVETFVTHKLHFRRKQQQKGKAAERAVLENRHQVGGNHRGLYGMVDARQDTVHTEEVNDMAKEWQGVQLTTKMCVSDGEGVQRNADDNDSAKPMVLVTDDEQADKKPANTACRSYTDYDIGRQAGRRVIGVVTSGQQPHLNNTHFAVGLCGVNAANDLFRQSYGRFLHPQAHVMVLFRNPRSEWLRPASVQMI